MPDETNPNTNQTPEKDNGTPPETGAKNTTPPGTPTGDKQFTQADVDRLITERLDRERKKYSDYDATKARLKELEGSSKTEAQKMQEKLDDLTARFETTQREAKANAVKAAIVAEAARLEFVDPQDAYELLKNRLTVEDDGSVKDLEAALKKLLGEKPYLKKTASKINPTNPAGGQALTLDAIKKMTPTEINARWDDVQKVLAGR